LPQQIHLPSLLHFSTLLFCLLYRGFISSPTASQSAKTLTFFPEFGPPKTSFIASTTPLDTSCLSSNGIPQPSSPLKTLQSSTCLSFIAGSSDDFLVLSVDSDGNVERSHQSIFQSRICSLITIVERISCLVNS